MQRSWWDSAAAPGGGLAQRIVDVLGPVVQQHINLMNSAGNIIASTDAGRIGAEHRAAMEVLRTGRTVVVEHSRDGVPDRPGINLPLVIDGERVGVIGVTGEPAEVKPLAQVVLLTVELLIEQESEHHASMAVSARAREVVAALVSESHSSSAVQELMAASGVGSGPWCLGVWAADEALRDGAAQPPADAEKVVTAVNDGTARGLQGTARATVWRGLLWVVAGPGQMGEGFLGGQGRSLVVSGIEELGELRSWARDMTALGRSAALLGDGSGAGVGLPVELSVMLSHLPVGTRRRLAEKGAQLTAPQREAVQAVVRAGTLAEAARVLYVHRNTLLQRVERIREVAGLDLRRSDEGALLQLAVAAAEVWPKDGWA